MRRSGDTEGGRRGRYGADNGKGGQRKRGTRCVVERERIKEENDVWDPCVSGWRGRVEGRS